MRVLVAPQELKGTLTATQAAAAMARGLAAARPELELDLQPLADGGPGTAEAIAHGAGDGWRPVEVEVEDALGKPVRARLFVHAEGRRAVADMAEASGLTRLGERREALAASTFGTGQLIAAAVEQGCDEVLLGLGGSATTDGGAGALCALGVRLLDASGRPIGRGGGALRTLARIDLSAIPRALRELRLRVATDVRSALLGPTGAARAFAPQKGATPSQVASLEEGLGHFAALLEASAGRPGASEAAGMGAAGGLAFGLCVGLGAGRVDGFEEVARAVQLESRIGRADQVLTAEGRLDSTSSLGKGPWRLAALGQDRGVGVVCFSGSPPSGSEQTPFTSVVTVGSRPDDSPEVAAARLEEAVLRWARGALG